MAISEDIQKLYIAYFGRPADPDGLSFYLATANQRFGGDFGPILPVFFDSEEYKALYPFDIRTTAGRNSAVQQVYQNLLNRTADPEGLAFYSNLLASNPASGLSKLVLDVLNGARGIDVDTIQAKVLAASLFTSQLDANEKQFYAGNQAVLIAREFLSTIDANDIFQPQSTGMSRISQEADVFINRLVQNTSPSSVFTTLRDDVKGQNGVDDNFSGFIRFVNGAVDSASTLTNGDTINGMTNGANGDTLNLNVSGNRLTDNPSVALGLTSVEKIVVRNTETDAVRNISFALNQTDAALNLITVQGERFGPGFNAGTAFTGLKNILDVTYELTPATSASLPVTPDLESQVNASRRTVNLAFDAAAVASGVDAMTVNLTGDRFSPIVSAIGTDNQSRTPSLANFELTANGIEQLFIKNSPNDAVAGPNSLEIIRSVVLGTGSGVNRIAIVGSDAARLRVDASAIGAQITEFDATRVVNVNNGIVFDIGAGLRSTQVLRGGASVSDVLVLSAPETLNQSTLDAIAGFETIRLDAGSSQVLNVKGVRGVNTVELRGSAVSDSFSVSNIQHATFGNTSRPEVFISRENQKINNLQVNLTTETLGNVGERLDIGLSAEVGLLNIANSRAVRITTDLPVVQDFIERVADRRVINTLTMTSTTDLLLDTTMTPTTGTIEFGAINTDVLRTITAVGATRILMNGGITKSSDVAVDINGGSASDRIFGSNRSDNIAGGSGADFINIADGNTPREDRIIFRNADFSTPADYGDSIIGFAPSVDNTVVNSDTLVFDRPFLFIDTDPMAAGVQSTISTSQFALTTTTTTTGGLLGVGGTTTTTVSEDSRIKVLAADMNGVFNRLDSNDVIAVLSNASRNELGITATDVASNVAKIQGIINSRLTVDQNAGGTVDPTTVSYNKFLLFVANDVDTFAYQFTRANSTGDFTLVGGGPVVKLIGVNTAAPLSTIDFELID